MHKEYILLNGFRKAKRGFTAGFHVPLNVTSINIAKINQNNSFQETTFSSWIWVNNITQTRGCHLYAFILLS